MQDFFTGIETVLKAPMTLALLGFAAAMLGVLGLLQSIKPAQETPKPGTTLFDRLRRALGAESFPAVVFIFFALLWFTLLVILLAGLIWVIITIVWGGFDPEKRDAVWDFRFLIAQLAGLTAVIGAIVAFPITIIRLRLSAEQTRINTDTLFNEKINNATTDLHAQRQVTERRDDGTSVDVWQDDIVRRNAAIDRLEALAVERPDMASRIARMLMVYLTELTREYPAIDPPKGANPDKLRDWAGALTPARSDMEKAAQTLGRLRDIPIPNAESVRIDLSEVNLQGFKLTGLNFNKANLSGARMEGADLFEARMEGANLIRARMEGADLSWAWMQGANLFGARMEGAILSRARMQGANLYEARMQGADLRVARTEGAILSGSRMDQSTNLAAANTTRAAVKSVDWENVPVSADQIKSMFGDASVILPPDLPQPPHWPEQDLNLGDFLTEWEKWQADPAAYTPPENL